MEGKEFSRVPEVNHAKTLTTSAEPSAADDAQAFAENYPKTGEGLPEPLDAHVTYIAAALSWYDGSECGPDVHEAWDYIVTSLRDMRADYLRVLGEKNDALFGKAEPRLCGACGEMVTGPCHHPNDPCGLFTAPPILDTDAVCTACRCRFAHAPDCPNGDVPWPTIPAENSGSEREASRAALSATDESPLLLSRGREQ